MKRINWKSIRHFSLSSLHFRNRICSWWGITKGYEEAVELVEQIVQEVYEQTGGCDIRSYILEKSREDKMVLHILLIILKIIGIIIAVLLGLLFLFLVIFCVFRSDTGWMRRCPER